MQYKRNHRSFNQTTSCTYHIQNLQYDVLFPVRVNWKEANALKRNMTNFEIEKGRAHWTACRESWNSQRNV